MELLKALAFEESEFTPDDFGTGHGLYRDLSRQYEAGSLVQDATRVEPVTKQLCESLASEETQNLVRDTSLQSLAKHNDFRKKLGSGLLALRRNKKARGFMNVLGKSVAPQVFTAL